MSNFPSPAARDEAYQKAVAAFESRQWSTASDLFETLYQDQQTPELNRYVVASLYHNEKYLMAEQYAAEQNGLYLTSAKDFQLRLDVALKNQQFIFAREFCALAAAETWRAGGLAQIEAAEAASTETLAATQRVIAKQFYHLGDVPFNEQRERLEHARQLPLAMYLQGVQYLLVDPFLHPLLRADLLEGLMRLHVDQTVKVHWLDDQTYTVAVKDLQPVGTSKAAVAFQKYLQEDLGQQDPMLAANLQQTITLQLMMLYPFIDRTITDPVSWAQAIAGLPLTATVSEEMIKEMQYWQNTLNRFMAELFGAIGEQNPENPENE